MSQDLKKKKQDTVQPEQTVRPAPSERRKSRAAISDWEEAAPAKRLAPASEGSFSAWRRKMRRKIRHIQRRWHHIVREVRKHNFPESDRAPILLVLFAWNMLPMLGSLLREKTWGRRKQRLHSIERLWAKMERHKLHPAVFLGVACTLAVIIAFCSEYTIGTTVRYDGEVIGAVESESTAEAAQHGQHIPGEQDQLDRCPLRLREVVLLLLPDDVPPPPLDMPDLPPRPDPQDGQGALQRPLLPLRRSRLLPVGNGRAPPRRVQFPFPPEGNRVSLFQILTHRSPVWTLSKSYNLLLFFIIPLFPGAVKPFPLSKS